MNNAVLEHIVSKCRQAEAGGFGLLSTGEQIAAALVLNRPDWLAETGYTMVEGLNRLGPEWRAQLDEAERIIKGKAV